MDPDYYHELPDLADMCQMAADALCDALIDQNINWSTCGADHEDGGTVSVTLGDMSDASRLMSLAVIRDDTVGSLYDRATGGCFGVSQLAEFDESGVDQILDSSWLWVIHPVIVDGAVVWHVVVTMPYNDVFEIVATLNANRPVR